MKILVSLDEAKMTPPRSKAMVNNFLGIFILFYFMVGIKNMDFNFNIGEIVVLCFFFIFFLFLDKKLSVYSR